MSRSNEYFLAFKKSYYAWVYAVDIKTREDAWWDYCHARDLFFGSGYGLKEWGVVPRGQA